MSSENPSAQELKQGFKECKLCGSLLLLEAGFEVKTSYCEQCHKHVASKEEFFNVPIEILSK
jgi:hypothetical protein